MAEQDKIQRRFEETFREGEFELVEPTAPDNLNAPVPAPKGKMHIGGELGERFGEYLVVDQMNENPQKRSTLYLKRMSWRSKISRYSAA